MNLSLRHAVALWLGIGFSTTWLGSAAERSKDVPRRPPVVVRYKMVKMSQISAAGPGMTNTVVSGSGGGFSASASGGASGGGIGSEAISGLQRDAVVSGFSTPVERSVLKQNGPVGYARKRPFMRRFFSLFNPFAPKELGVGGRTTLDHQPGFGRPMPRVFRDERTMEPSGTLWNFSK